MSRCAGRSRALRALGALAGVATLGFTLTACGIPTQPSASPISTARIQTRLPSTRPVTNPCVKSYCVPVDVYFVTANGRLRPEGRVVPPDAKLSTVIGALLGGPTATEHAGGIGTALGAGIRLLSARVTGKVATLNFNLDFGELSGTQEVLGVAQVVYTVTAVMPGGEVTFEVADVAIPVPVATGVVATGPVHESQYATLLTTTASTTTTTP